MKFNYMKYINKFNSSMYSTHWTHLCLCLVLSHRSDKLSSQHPLMTDVHENGGMMLVLNESDLT